ncbi:hypothetical protein GL213_09970 [Halogeometricum borinquense]|nr:hypothetical protein GL213_09970 [Halogeometricum borinquense]
MHLRVSEDQKNRWQTYVEENGEYDTLTDLIRTSVEREISDVTTTQGGGNADSGRLDTLDERTDKILSRLSTIEGALGDALEAMHTAGVEVDDTTASLWNKLPEGGDNAQTVEEMMEHNEAMGERGLAKYRIRLEQLFNSTNAVKRTYIRRENDGTEYELQHPAYYKDV